MIDCTKTRVDTKSIHPSFLVNSYLFATFFGEEATNKDEDAGTDDRYH